MPVLEATPEIAEQATRNQEVGSDAGSAHGEASAGMTAEQAIKVCPYLGKLAIEDPELALKNAEQYISNPEKITQMHPEREAAKSRLMIVFGRSLRQNLQRK